MTVTEALQTRRSVHTFNPDVKISKEELFELLNLANLSPSSMNLQPWEYVVCVTPEAKSILQAASYNQAKVSQASAAIILLGNLHQHLHANDVATSNIEKGYFGEEKRAGFVGMATGAYAENPKAQRDEAYRGGALWATSFTLAAKEAGWETAILGGFEPLKVSDSFHIPATHLPVMLICIGKLPKGEALLPRNDRFPAEKLAHWESW